MDIQRVKYLAILVLALNTAPAYADANRFYQSLASSIKRVNAQADVRLSPGIWRTIYGDTALIWNVKGQSAITLLFSYNNGDTAGSVVSFTPRLDVTVTDREELCGS